MANRSKFKLEIRIRNRRGQRVYCAPVFAANGRLKPMAAMVNGKPEAHPEGIYYLRYTSEAGKRVYERLGRDSIEALNIMHRRELARASKASGLEVLEPAAPVRIDDAIAKYLTRVAISRSERTKNEFNLFLPQFRSLCNKVYLHEITADDLLLYAEWVRQQGLAPQHMRSLATSNEIPRPTVTISFGRCLPPATRKRSCCSGSSFIPDAASRRPPTPRTGTSISATRR